MPQRGVCYHSHRTSGGEFYTGGFADGGMALDDIDDAMSIGTFGVRTD